MFYRKRVSFVALTFCLFLDLSNGQGGFFSNFRDAIFGARPPRASPPFSPRQPPPQQSFGQQQQFNQNQQPINQPQQQFNPQPAGFGGNPQRPSVGGPNNPPARSRGNLNGCPVVEPNHFWNGNGYIITWLINGDGKQDIESDPCQKFTGEQADQYCKLAGGRAISLDTNERAEHFMDQARQYAKRFFWTGGRLDHPNEVVIWPTGKTEGIGGHGTRFWSHTGGAEPPRPQPDNRDGNEVCLAVLNNFYADGIKWHDVACHHKKPTMCEFGSPRVFI